MRMCTWIGRSPARAMPMAAPVMASSERGVPKTRSGPYLASSPLHGALNSLGIVHIQAEENDGIVTRHFLIRRLAQGFQDRRGFAPSVPPVGLERAGLECFFAVVNVVTSINQGSLFIVSRRKVAANERRSIRVDLPAYVGVQFRTTPETGCSRQKPGRRRFLPRLPPESVRILPDRPDLPGGAPDHFPSRVWLLRRVR